MFENLREWCTVNDRADYDVTIASAYLQGLREECSKLQKRVLDLEDQNRQLRDMFHQRLKFNSDPVLQVREISLSLTTRTCHSLNYVV